MKRILVAVTAAMIASTAHAQFSAGEIAGIILGGAAGGAGCSQIGGGTGRTAAIIGCSTLGAIVGQQITKPQQPQYQQHQNPYVANTPSYVFQGNPYSQGYNQAPIVITRGPGYQRNSCQVVTRTMQTITNQVTVESCACWNAQRGALVEAEMAYCRN